MIVYIVVYALMGCLCGYVFLSRSSWINSDDVGLAFLVVIIWPFYVIGLLIKRYFNGSWL